jgi:hypothetical protein
MIGFIVEKNTADVIIESIKQDQISNYGSHYWSPGSYEIFSGENAGKFFIPFTDQMINTVLREGKKPLDFEEGKQLITMLGGLDSRVVVSLDELKQPEE